MYVSDWITKWFAKSFVICHYILCTYIQFTQQSRKILHTYHPTNFQIHLKSKDTFLYSVKKVQWRKSDNRTNKKTEIQTNKLWEQCNRSSRQNFVSSPLTVSNLWFNYTVKSNWMPVRLPGGSKLMIAQSFVICPIYLFC